MSSPLRIVLALALVLGALPHPAAAQPGTIHPTIVTPAGRTTFPVWEPIQFSAVIDQIDCVALTRFWDFGDGATSDAQDPLHTYDAPGNYHVTLTVTSTCEKPRTAQAELKIRERGPLAVLVATPDPTTAGHQVLLDASASRAPLDSVYRFAVDGVVVAEQATPTLHWTLTSAGTHVAAVTVIAPGGDPKHPDHSGNHYGHLGGGQSTATDAFAIVAGPAASVSVTPGDAAVGPGGIVQYEARAFDAYGNPVDAPASWSSTCGEIEDGLFVAPTQAGPCSVSAQVGDARGAAALVVVPGPLAGLAVVPEAVEVPPGGTATFSVQGWDAYGNAVAVDPTWGSTCGTVTEDGVYVAPDSSAECLVQAEAGDVQDSASVVVQPEPPVLAGITVTGPASMVAGTTADFLAEGHDADGNPVPLETSTFSFTAPTLVGTAQACHTEQGVTGCADVQVVPDALARIVVEPAEASVVAGRTFTFSARGFDRHGNEVAVDPAFTAARGAFGGATYHAPALVGADVVTATADGVEGTGAVDVVPDALDHIVVSGPTRVAAGAVADYEARGYDRFGNAVELAPAWTAGVGEIDAVGRLAAPTLAPQEGDVVATQGDVSGALPVVVTPADVARVDVTPPDATANVGQSILFGATAFDAYDNVVEDAVFSWDATQGTVTQTGLFEAQSVGHGTVAATASGVTGVALVTVEEALLVVVTMDQEEYGVEEAFGEGVWGTVQVYRADGSPLEGARVVVYVDHRLVGVLVPETPFDVVASGETDEDGRFRFRVGLMDQLPGDHTVVGTASWGVNGGLAGDSYRVFGTGS